MGWKRGNNQQLKAVDLTRRFYGRRLYKTMEELLWYDGDSDGSFGYHVPKGFITDLASVPPILNALLPTPPNVDAPAALHDYLYLGQPIGAENPFEYVVSMKRATADLVFLKAMLDNGVAGWRARIYYLAVRVFGWMAWRKAS